MDQQNETKGCPYCAETIPSDTRTCPYCHRDTTAEPRDSSADQRPAIPETPSMPARRSRGCGFRSLLAVLAVLVLIYLVVRPGFYTVQPIGTLPEGVTLLVRRASGEALFESPDGLCLRIQGSVSLLCGGGAKGRAPLDRIIVRLPYLEWAYLLSTGGQKFDR